MELAALGHRRRGSGKKGFRGLLGVDMLELSVGSSPAFAFAEVNGRVNASTYALALFEGINRTGTASE